MIPANTLRLRNIEHIRARAEHRSAQLRNHQPVQEVENQPAKYEKAESVKPQSIAKRFKSFAGRMFKQGRIGQKV